MATANMNLIIDDHDINPDVARIERRGFAARVQRASGDDAPENRISGYAALYNVLSEDLGGFRERIAPGAFDASLASGADVRAFWNHNPDLVLGRVQNETLRLLTDDEGLGYDLDLPDTQPGRDALVLIGRGDVDQMSFGFYILEDSWDQVDDETVRTLIRVDLIEISLAAIPAYPQTSAAVRVRYNDYKRSLSGSGDGDGQTNGGAGAADAGERPGDVLQARRILRKITLDDLK